MTPKEIIDAVAQEAGLSPELIRAILVLEAKVQMAALERGEEVKSLLGKYWPVEQAARTVRHPKTGEEIHIPDRIVIKFKLREATDEAGSEEEAPPQATV
jgi:nucleoid DNA-binding protein